MQSFPPVLFLPFSLFSLHPPASPHFTTTSYLSTFLSLFLLCSLYHTPFFIIPTLPTSYTFSPSHLLSSFSPYPHPPTCPYLLALLSSHISFPHVLTILPSQTSKHLCHPPTLFPFPSPSFLFLPSSPATQPHLQILDQLSILCLEVLEPDSAIEEVVVLAWYGGRGCHLLVETPPVSRCMEGEENVEGTKGVILFCHYLFIYHFFSKRGGAVVK